MTEKDSQPSPQFIAEFEKIEERELSIKEEDLKKEIASLDLELRKLNLNAKIAQDLTSMPESESQKNPQKEVKDLPVINRKGQVVLQHEEIQLKYNNSFPFIRNFHLPFCYQCIKGKIYFWLAWSWPLSYAYNVKKLLESGKSWKDLAFKPLLKYYGIIFFAGSLFSVFESFYFEDFCDVNSYHYMDNYNKSNVMNELKKKFINRVEKKS